MGKEHFIKEIIKTDCSYQLGTIFFLIKAEEL